MKHVTALYRTHEIAARVREAIVSQGVSEGDVRIMPEDGGRDIDLDTLGELGLSDEDARHYRDAVASGDSLVTAHVDEERAELVQAAMRDPDATADEDALRERHPEDQLIAPAGKPVGAVGATTTIGAADDGRTTYRDPMDPKTSPID